MSRVSEIIQKELNFKFLRVFSTYFISFKINGKTNVSKIIKDKKKNQSTSEGRSRSKEIIDWHCIQMIARFLSY